MPGFREQRWGESGLWCRIGFDDGFLLAARASTCSDGGVSREVRHVCTVPTQVNLSDAIFVLDSVTGRLVGGAYNTQSNSFNQTFVRNVAADFGVVDKAQYLMVSGFANLKGSTIGQPANGVLYVGELTSGKVGCTASSISTRRNTAGSGTDPDQQLLVPRR